MINFPGAQNFLGYRYQSLLFAEAELSVWGVSVQWRKRRPPIPVVLEKGESELERILTGGSPAYSDNRFEDLKERLPYIASELEKRHITMYFLWREYRALMPGGYGYTQFCFHVNQYTQA